MTVLQASSQRLFQALNVLLKRTSRGARAEQGREDSLRLIFCPLLSQSLSAASPNVPTSPQNQGGKGMGVSISSVSMGEAIEEIAQIAI